MTLLHIILPILALQLSFANAQKLTLKQAKLQHVAKDLTDQQVSFLSDLTNITHMNEVLDNICVVRVVGTPGHAQVINYIKNTFNNLGWDVESDRFEDVAPRFGRLTFENIIVTLNPNAKRYLTLACHFDSKYSREGSFIGATDSAVPCAQLINLATVMNSILKSVNNNDLSLMFIFFDGEEAFVNWNATDSIYGARHLAKKWNRIRSSYGTDVISELDKMDMLVLLDLIGAPDPKFYNYFRDTVRWYSKLVNAEQRLASLEKFTKYSYGQPQQRYFEPYSVEAFIEDDHIPFLRKNVPIVHVIPHPFPEFWHKEGDNRGNIDMDTIENINKILRVFVASYLHVDNIGS